MNPIELFDNSGVRRQDRLLSAERSLELLRDCAYGVLSLIEPDGRPYGIPVSYAWDGATAIYIHCAPEGEKLRCIEASAEASFCVVGHTRVIPEKFTTAYESVLLRCHACTQLSDDERFHALMLIVEKYAPHLQEIGEKYARGSFHRTAIIRLDIKSISGKAKKVE